MTRKIDQGSTFSPSYEAGYPTKDTARAAFDEYDFQAAVQFYVWGYAYLNSLGFDQGCARLGGNDRTIYVFDKRLQPQQKVISANGEVIYAVTRLLDLTQGPWVLETPPRVRGHIWDFGQRPYEDLGDIGPDRGEGGKYLLVARDYPDDLPEGYFPVRALYSDHLVCLIRAFPGDEGGVEAAAAQAQKMRIYPLSEADAPAEQDFVLAGEREFSQEWPRDERAFDWLAEVVERDRLPAEAHAHLGNMRRLGLLPGEGFHPDERARGILARAAKTAEAIVLSMAFRSRISEPLYEGRRWEFTVNNVSPNFLTDNYEEVEERAGSWHQMWGNFAHYIPAQPGTGEFALLCYRESDGQPLIGSNLYRLTMPADVPVEQFWQVPVYSTTTRALIETDQRRATVTSTDEDLVVNDDGSVDVYVGPEAPEGYEANWIKTHPGEGWYTLLRLYAPLEPILEQGVGAQRYRAYSLEGDDHDHDHQHRSLARRRPRDRQGSLRLRVRADVRLPVFEQPGARP